MLGLVRFTFAMFVVIGHLTEGVRFVSHWGVFAVFGFYLVSGYLMTIVLNEKYFFQFSSFAANRFLRLFPIYYLVAIASAILIVLVPSSKDFHPAWETRHRILDLLGNVLIFPFEFYDASFRLVPPTWSISVELANYFLLWLLVARSRRLAIFSLLLSLVYHVMTFYLNMDWSTRYFPSYAALLPFSLGACLYFSRNLTSNYSIETMRNLLILSFLVWLANLCICGKVAGLAGPHFDLFFYVNLVSLVAFLYCLTRSSLSTRFSRSGKIFGDLAYPIFLTHWSVAYAMSLLIFSGQKKGVDLLVVSIPPILAISFALALLANRWLDPLRDKVRSGVILSKQTYGTDC